MITWRDAVLEALRRFSHRHSTRSVDRQRFIKEELDRIVELTDSEGQTPTQTLSRVLQELRDEGIVFFISNGNYLLVDAPLDIELEDLPDDAIDFAIKHTKLAIGILPAGDQQVLARQRKGKERIRASTLENYEHQCAFCDIREPNMLIASHVSRWADDPEARGNLSNLICMCKFHDALFESGYFSLTDEYQILKKNRTSSKTITLLLDDILQFRLPSAFRPMPSFLQNTEHAMGSNNRNRALTGVPAICRVVLTALDLSHHRRIECLC